MTTVIDHYTNYLAPLYEWMAGDIEAALVRSAAELDAANIPSKVGGTAVDFGAGIGLQALPLAQRGYGVIAIDSSEQLLAALRARAGSLPITTVNADVLEFTKHLQQSADTILCMGDTLTHLSSVVAVDTLFGAVARALAKGGVFVTTFRDYVTAPLTAERRFIPARSDARRILTCFLEYAENMVLVHDLLHQLENGHWVQRISSYPKLRLAPDWVATRLQSHGLAVRISTGAGGMVCVAATNG